MKILFCTEQYYPLQTGTATADYGLTLALAQAGYQVYVITSNMFNHQKIHREGAKHTVSSGSLERQATQIAPNLFVLDFHITQGNGGWQGELQAYVDFALCFECDLLVNVSLLTWNTDLLHDKLPKTRARRKILRTHGEYAFMSVCFGAKRLIKDALKFVLVRLGLWRSYAYAIYPWWLRQALTRSLKHYDTVFFLHEGSHGYAYLKPYCSKVGILPNGVFEKDICAPKILTKSLVDATTTPQPITSTPDCLINAPYLLNISNYYQEKGQDFVLRAYYLSLTTIPLIFIGSLNRDSTLEALQDLKTQLDKEHGFKEVHFLHGIERQQVLEFSKQATLFLHGSHAPYEAFPMVILESMQFGTPFICTDVGNVKDLCARLVVDTPEEMAQQINTLLGDPSYYTQIAQELHEKVKPLAYEKIIAKLEALV
ncbi:glycosyltransferase family 4 protein [Helicobacter labacensis]|uniref:glycosyltransferase family 4 protein n=1 Tax=Helicobacter labacensis TaxID=2316079 RepID=UPI000EB02360|nr:glycosyltransferase family 4 protein [Helicobacter labacensis]